jgi:predicted ATP-grasp superfamily ATP-dependent carboligase
MNILITGACGVTSRAVARSLKMSEHFKTAKLVGTDVAQNIYGLYEGLFERIYRVPPATAPGYLSVMGTICSKEAVDLAIVIPEPEVLFWVEHEMPVRSLLPPPRFCKIAISKRRTYEALVGEGLVPRFEIAARGDIVAGNVLYPAGKQVWVRDFAEGSTSGKGALRASSLAEIQAWAVLNPQTEEFMLADYLPGRNFACCLLFHNDRLVKRASYERIRYYMGHLVMSGISGNISQGKLVNDALSLETAEHTVRVISKHTEEEMHGIVTVDLREDAAGHPLVTEINLRHTACTSAFAQGGANMAEAQVLALLGQTSSIDQFEVAFPANNLILRDIDGLPLWIDDHREVNIGHSIEA